MNLLLDENIAAPYRSRSQKARVMTEDWVARNLYCVRCGHPLLKHFPNNAPVADFYCPHCQGQFELKSHEGRYGRIIMDGAYDTMMERLTSRTNPDLLVMEYLADESRIENLWIIPKYFFTPEISEKRRPLAATARRAAWTGCNIVWQAIPRLGKIALVKESTPIPAWCAPRQVDTRKNIKFLCCSRFASSFFHAAVANFSWYSCGVKIPSFRCGRS